jgi:hypothetical protein
MIGYYAIRAIMFVNLKARVLIKFFKFSMDESKKVFIEVAKIKIIFNTS